MFQLIFHHLILPLNYQIQLMNLYYLYPLYYLKNFLLYHMIFLLVHNFLIILK